MEEPNHKLRLISEHGCFGGSQRFYSHPSTEIGLRMRFSVYLPPQALQPGASVPALLYLAGLTCTEETFMIKAGAQRFAAQHGLALIAPDTSPRGANCPGESDDWDFGVAAGFYLDAMREPWKQHYRMESWLIRELLPTLCKALPLDAARLGIFGHSMGGHGALTLALRNPRMFKSLSAFAPISNPTNCPWGIKAFSGYLGEDKRLWQQHDASWLMSQRGAPPFPQGILVDQGLDDKFLEEQLKPEALEAACAQIGQPLTLRRHTGYDHGYFFISSFIEDHIAHHARCLEANA
jgi:S-formylglutathione hydrolase